MKTTTALYSCAIAMVFLVCMHLDAGAQPAGRDQGTSPALASQKSSADGVFVVRLKSPAKQTMNVEELVRDRDLNPGFLYRVKTGGYIGFSEADWVDKIEFRVFERPVTELPEYKRFSTLLVEINEKIWRIKETLGKYDLLALRLMSICEKTKFSSLQAIDDNILKQLSVYRRLNLLRALVLNALARFQKDRACRDLYADYERTLNIYEKQLTELTRNYRRLTRKALALAEDVKPAAEREAEKADQKRETDTNTEKSK
jgi:hypothetical protein